MTRLITTRFPSKCIDCKADIAAQERAFWIKGKGLRCSRCITVVVPQVPVDLYKDAEPLGTRKRRRQPQHVRQERLRHIT